LFIHQVGSTVSPTASEAARLVNPDKCKRNETLDKKKN